MGITVGYGKVGRSMPLTLDSCGTLGGDIECASVVVQMARRHPEDTFVLLGRNSGEKPSDIGMPDNIINPWVEWSPKFRELTDTSEVRGPNLFVEKQFRLKTIFDGLTTDSFVNCDAHVWWIGQHGTSNSPIPFVAERDKYTKPQDWCAYYASYFFHGINAWREVDPLNREEVYLNADARNTLKCRDLRWPLVHPVLSQHNYFSTLKHERYGFRGYDIFEHYKDFYDIIGGGNGGRRLGFTDDGEVWVSNVSNTYSRLEINALLPGTPFGDLLTFDDTWLDRKRFGLFINEAGRNGSPTHRRLLAMQEYVLPLEPNFVHGFWSLESRDILKREIYPVPWDEYVPKLQSVRSTFTTPSSCSEWATCKPWEAFAVGTVCFFHPLYDTQNNILGDAPTELREFLRVQSPAELACKVDRMNTNPDDWKRIITMQRAHFEKACRELTYMQKIEERVWK